MRVRKMKVLKGISLFFVYPMIMFLLGFGCGVKTEHFFYPGKYILSDEDYQTREIVYETTVLESPDTDTSNTDEILEVSSDAETLCADTEYVLEEVDVLKKTSVETTKDLPQQYLGMDREQFMDAMEEYESAPPLVEQKRGFESLEVLSFSRERVKVRMSYRYVQPSQGFYLAVENHEIVVYLEDKETIYINTGIMLETLPEDLQMQIMQMYYIEGEGDLYNFLEAYSS